MLSFSSVHFSALWDSGTHFRDRYLTTWTNLHGQKCVSLLSGWTDHLSCWTGNAKAVLNSWVIGSKQVFVFMKILQIFTVKVRGHGQYCPLDQSNVFEWVWVGRFFWHWYWIWLCSRPPQLLCNYPKHTYAHTHLHLPVLQLWNQLSLTCMCPVGLTDCIHILIQSSWHPGSSLLVEAFSLSVFSHRGSWILSMLFPSCPAFISWASVLNSTPLNILWSDRKAGYLSVFALKSSTVQNPSSSMKVGLFLLRGC